MDELSCCNANLYEFLVIRDNILIHKQIEKRDGLTFYRIKKRKI